MRKFNKISGGVVESWELRVYSWQLTVDGWQLTVDSLRLLVYGLRFIVYGRQYNVECGSLSGSGNWNRDKNLF